MGRGELRGSSAERRQPSQSRPSGLNQPTLAFHNNSKPPVKRIASFTHLFAGQPESGENQAQAAAGPEEEAYSLNPFGDFLL
jgi:hypothetical protein